MKGGHRCSLALLMQKLVLVGFMRGSGEDLPKGRSWTPLKNFNFLNVHTEVKSFEHRLWILPFLSKQFYPSIPPLRRNNISFHTYILHPVSCKCRSLIRSCRRRNRQLYVTVSFFLCENKREMAKSLSYSGSCEPII